MDDPARPEVERRLLATWGAVIRRYRQWRQLSRRELAGRAGLSPVYLGEIERGEKDPSSHSLCLIADALAVPLSELYLRVATQLSVAGETVPDAQPSLPLGTREAGQEYLEGVNLAQDETAFEVYRAVRLLRGDQQVSLLILARTLLPAE